MWESISADIVCPLVECSVFSILKLSHLKLWPCFISWFISTKYLCLDGVPMFILFQVVSATDFFFVGTFVVLSVYFTENDSWSDALRVEPQILRDFPRFSCFLFGLPFRVRDNCAAVVSKSFTVKFQNIFPRAAFLWAGLLALYYILRVHLRKTVM